LRIAASPSGAVQRIAAGLEPRHRQEPPPPNSSAVRRPVNPGGSQSKIASGPALFRLTRLTRPVTPFVQQRWCQTLIFGGIWRHSANSRTCFWTSYCDLLTARFRIRIPGPERNPKFEPLYSSTDC